MAYELGSPWNDKVELECLLILKIWEESGFPRNLRAELCRKLEQRTKKSPSHKSLKAKVGNYGSLAGFNNYSKYSQNSKRLFDKYKNHSIEQLKSVIKDL